MKRTAFLLFLLLSVPAFGEDRWRASVLRVQHGFGAAMAYAPNAAWDVEAGVSEQSYEQPVSTFSVGANPAIPITMMRHYTAHPIDLFVTRHFPVSGPVTMFLRAGARYVEASGQQPRTTFGDSLPVTSFTGIERRASAQAGGGVLLRLTPRTALRAEVTRLLRSNGSRVDPLTRTAAGLSWHF
jgi:hypothetical protein